MMSLPGPSSSKERTTVNLFARRLGPFLFFVVLSFNTFVAQTKNCDCQFDTPSYEAYGTHGACGIFMHKKQHSCEIAFSGTGANANALRRILGDQALANQFEIAPQIFMQYVAYEKEGQKGLFLDPNFIEKSLPVLERAALFRQSTEKLPRKDIDILIGNFAKDYSKKIAATFAGKAGPFDANGDHGSVFSVGPGYVELNFQQGTAILRVVYFSDNPR
jgi:hypothetical protein